MLFKIIRNVINKLIKISAAILKGFTKMVIGSAIVGLGFGVPTIVYNSISGVIYSKLFSFAKVAASFIRLDADSVISTVQIPPKCIFQINRETLCN